MQQLIYFGGNTTTSASERNSTSVADSLKLFYHYIHKVWVNSHFVPTEPNQLRSFDVVSLMPEFRIYMGNGGILDVSKGATLEETWLGLQLLLRQPLTCLINAQQPLQPNGRITRQLFLQPNELVEEFRRMFPVQLNPKNDIQGQMTRWGELSRSYLTLVYDGKVGHCVSFVGTNNKRDSFIYFDPMPSRSLLCQENNQAGVSAELANDKEWFWVIPADQLERVIYAVFKPTRD